jgi:hypothetical protein
MVQPPRQAVSERERRNQNEAPARSERNFATFVSFCLAASNGIFRGWKRRFESSKALPKARKVIAIFTKSFPRKSGSIFF